MTDIAREEIGDGESVSRITYADAYDDDGHLMWLGGKLFEFPTEYKRCDSLVWRKYAATLEEVHRIGCNGKRSSDYRGFISANVGKLREVETASKHRFEVNHEPNEGQHHAEICVRPIDKLSPSKKADIRTWLSRLFSAPEYHLCE